MADALLYRMSMLRHAIDEAVLYGTLTADERSALQSQASLLVAAVSRLGEQAPARQPPVQTPAFRRLAAPVAR